MLTRRNSKPHINRNSRRVIMKKSRIKNFVNKTKHPYGIKNYERQRNYAVNLNKNAEFEYFSKYNSEDSKPFWLIVSIIFIISTARLILVSC